MLELNKVYTGTITGIKATYALTKVENVIGIIHISEVSDYHVKNIGTYLKLGQKYNMMLIAIDAKNKKYKFSYKRINAKLLKVRKTIVPTASGFINLKKNLDERLKLL